MDTLLDRLEGPDRTARILREAGAWLTLARQIERVAEFTDVQYLCPIVDGRVVDLHEAAQTLRYALLAQYPEAVEYEGEEHKLPELMRCAGLERYTRADGRVGWRTQ